MPTATHFRKLERMYASAPINQYFQPQLTIGAGTAQLVIPIRPDFHHAAHATHGVVYFKAMDDAAFFAASSLVEDRFVLTTGFTVYFTRPILEGNMTAEAHVVHTSRRLLIADVVVRDDAGREIGRGSGTFMPSNTPLTPEIGYQ